MGLSNIDMQPLLVIWTLGAPLVIAAVSVFVDGTFDRPPRDRQLPPSV
jgi:hypothetical protein